MGYVKCPNCDKPVTQGDTSEKSIVDVNKHKGTMHKLLGIPEKDRVRDHYSTGASLAKALHGKASRQKLQSLLNYAANINGEADQLFRDASTELKKLYKSK